MNKKSSNFEGGGNGLNFNLMQRKAKKAIYFSREIWWPVWEIMDNPGELAYMETGNESATKRHFGSQEVQVLI